MSIQDLMSDEEWAIFEPFVTRRGEPSGRRSQNHRRALDGVFWIARTSARWCDLPEFFGKWPLPPTVTSSSSSYSLSAHGTRVFVNRIWRPLFCHLLHRSQGLLQISPLRRVETKKRPSEVNPVVFGRLGFTTGFIDIMMRVAVSSLFAAYERQKS